MTASTAAYEQLGVGYRAFRGSDPSIQAAIERALGDARTVLNVGAGTGSYEPTDRRTIALELSERMIAQRPREAATCVRGDACALPFRSSGFDAAMAIFTLHHWDHPLPGLVEMRRVARRLVIFTFDPAIHNGFWLFREYFPQAVETPAQNPMSPSEIARAIRGHVVPVLVPHDCADGFGWAYWRRPYAYLDADVRRCISALAQLPEQVQVTGAERLAHDLDTGTWQRRHDDLRGLTAIDGGYRLVITGEP